MAGCLRSRSGEGLRFGGFEPGRSYARPRDGDGDVTESGGWAVGLVFSNHLGCERWVVGEPAVCYGVVKGLGWRGSESGRRISLDRVGNRKNELFCI